MNKSMDTALVIEGYRAKFDNYRDHTEGGKFFPNPPLKYAANHGAGAELVERMQAAIDAGQPMDFNAFAAELQERSAAE